MSNNCFCCKNRTGFYIWSTSRNFPRVELIQKNRISDKGQVKLIEVQGVPICFSCYEKLKKG